MLRTDLTDHRRSEDDELLAALQAGEPLALAEVYHRTVAAAHAVARRLLVGAAEVEALLREVYGRLWREPPADVALEGWVRAACFDIGVAHLRARELAPAAPSLALLLPELPAPDVRYLDTAERAMAELDDPARRALLLAHDTGRATWEQDNPDAAEALDRALAELAGPDSGGAETEHGSCRDVPLLADWTLGLVPPARAGEVRGQLAVRPECVARSRMLRRGRRRLEGLPPTPDMGQRVLVAVLAASPAVAAAPLLTPAAPTSDAPAGDAIDTRPPADAAADLEPAASPYETLEAQPPQIGADTTAEVLGEGELDASDSTEDLGAARDAGSVAPEGSGPVPLEDAEVAFGSVDDDITGELPVLTPPPATEDGSVPEVAMAVDAAAPSSEASTPLADVPGAPAPDGHDAPRVAAMPGADGPSESDDSPAQPPSSPLPPASQVTMQLSSPVGSVAAPLADVPSAPADDRPDMSAPPNAPLDAQPPAADEAPTMAMPAADTTVDEDPVAAPPADEAVIVDDDLTAEPPGLLRRLLRGLAMIVLLLVGTGLGLYLGTRIVEMTRP